MNITNTTPDSALQRGGRQPCHMRVPRTCPEHIGPRDPLPANAITGLLRFAPHMHLPILRPSCSVAALSAARTSAGDAEGRTRAIASFLLPASHPSILPLLVVFSMSSFLLPVSSFLSPSHSALPLHAPVVPLTACCARQSLWLAVEVQSKNGKT